MPRRVRPAMGAGEPGLCTGAATGGNALPQGEGASEPFGESPSLQPSSRALVDFTGANTEGCGQALSVFLGMLLAPGAEISEARLGL